MGVISLVRGQRVERGSSPACRFASAPRPVVFLNAFLRQNREKRKAYALDSGKESDTLTLENTVLWQENDVAIKT
jgi:hypothetical protein